MISSLKITDILNISGDFGHLYGELSKTENGYEFIGENISLNIIEEEYDFGVVMRKASITCTKGKITLTNAAQRFCFDGGEYEVYTQYGGWCNESRGEFAPLVTGVTAQSKGIRSNFGASPFAVLWNLQSGRGTAFHLITDSAWKIDFTNTPDVKDYVKVVANMGINNSNLWFTLNEGESLNLPSVVYYDVKNKVDLDSYKIHTFANKYYERKQMPVIYNNWLYTFTELTDEKIISQIEPAAKLGVEYFVIDAGWYGDGDLWGDRGDWDEDFNHSLKGQMKKISDLVHQKGMKFGIWLEPETAGHKAKVLTTHTDFYENYEGANYLKFNKIEAVDYITQKVSNLVEKYNLDFIKFDFNQDKFYDENGKAHIDYIKGKREFLRRLKNKFPNLFIECCAAGGYSVSLSEMEYADSFWMSDSPSVTEQVRIYKDTIKRIPANVLEKQLAITSLQNSLPHQKNKNSKIVSSKDGEWNNAEICDISYFNAFLFGSPISFSCNLLSLKDDDFKYFADLVKEFKQNRDFLKNAVSKIICDTKNITAIEYMDAELKNIYITIFAKDTHQGSVTLFPEVDSTATYEFGGEILSGAEIGEGGLKLPISSAYTALLVKLKKI